MSAHIRLHPSTEGVPLKRTRSTVLATTTASALALTLAACGGGGGGTGGGGDGGGDFRPRGGNVTMLVPFGAGGGSDLAGRATGTMIEAADDELTVSVENREGGSGAVGYSYFLGENGNESLLLATETALLALPISGEVEFDYTDFTPIMKLGDDFTLMVTNADSPYETCADVVEAAESERVVAGISGITGLDNIVFTLTEQETGAKFDRVPFESGGELTAALLGGQIDVASLNPGEIIGQLESGDVKALCAYSEERYSDYEELADIETAKEQGIDVAFAQFRGVLAPGGISEEARNFWIETMEAAVETEEYQTYIEDNYLQPNTASGDEFVEYLEGNNELLQQVLEG
jgi:putative tricarboxylic transport membrane protein